jgi:hypothetical protein
VHVTGLPPVHWPAWQASVRVHALWSSHVVPSAAFGLEHFPLVGSQAPAMWHWSAATQVTGLPPVQTPAWHESVWVQRFPSLHVVPSATGGFEHVPDAGSHVPVAWH